MSNLQIVASPIQPELNDRDLPRRVGLIALATDLTSEGDLNRAFAPLDLSMHVTRVAFANPTTPRNLRRMLPHLAKAAALIAPEMTLDAICFSCTAASAVIGDAEVTAAIQSTRPGVPVVTPSEAARVALMALGVHKVAVLTPYVRVTSAKMYEYFVRNGLDVRHLHYLDMADDREMARVSRHSIINAALAADRDDAQALFISCTGLPAISTIAEIEQRLGKPVVTSNQATAWMLSRLAGFNDYVPEALGSLFHLPLPGTSAVAAQ